MDKYEYKVRSEEISKLIDKERYAEAVKIADTIDWRRVKSAAMLLKIAALYRISRRNEDSREMLMLAYERYPTNRSVVYSLCELSIELDDVVAAIEYYKQFVKLAPKDNGVYTLRYRILEAQEASLEERIEILEELKKKDYQEEWAYELAYLYHRVGLSTKCVEECDDIILWFGDGSYVMKAMELKAKHVPLTDMQQQNYNIMLGNAGQNYSSGNYDSENYDSENYDSENYDSENYNTEDYGSGEYDTEVYAGQNYSADGYDGQNYDADQNYNTERYDGQGYGAGQDYNAEGYAGQGYDAENYDPQDYNDGNYDPQSYDAGGYSGQSYEEGGYDTYGNNYEQGSYESESYGNGYGQESYQDGQYTGEGYSQQGYQDDQYTGEGYSQQEYQDDQYTGEGYNQQEYQNDQYTEEGYSQQGYQDEQYAAESYNQGGYPDEQYAGDGYGQYTDSNYAQNNYVDDGYGNLSYVDGAYQDNGFTSEFYVEQIYDENGNLIGPEMYADNGYPRESDQYPQAEQPRDNGYTGQASASGEYRNGLHLVETTAAPAGSPGDMSQYNTINLQKVVAESMKELFPDENDDVFAEDREKYNSSADLGDNTGDTRIFAGVFNTVRNKQNDSVSAQTTTGRVNIAQMVTGVSEAVPEPHTGAIKKVLVPGDDARSIKSDSDMEELRDTTEKSVDDEHVRMEYNDENVYHEQSLMGTNEADGLQQAQTGPMKLDNVLVEWERMKQDNAKKNQEKIKKRVLTQTGKLFTDFDNSIKSGILGELEREEAEAERRNQEGTVQKSNDGFLDADVTGDIPQHPVSEDDFDTEYVTGHKKPERPQETLKTEDAAKPKETDRQEDRSAEPAAGPEAAAYAEKAGQGAADAGTDAYVQERDRAADKEPDAHTQELYEQGMVTDETGEYTQKISATGVGHYAAGNDSDADGYTGEVYTEDTDGHTGEIYAEDTDGYADETYTEDMGGYTEEIYTENIDGYVKENDGENAGAYTRELYDVGDTEPRTEENYIEENCIEENYIEENYTEEIYAEDAGAYVRDVYAEKTGRYIENTYVEETGGRMEAAYAEDAGEYTEAAYAEETGAYTNAAYRENSGERTEQIFVENADVPYFREDTGMYGNRSYEEDTYEDLEDAYNESPDATRYIDRRQNRQQNYQYNENDLDPEDAESIAEMAKEDALKTQEIKMNTADLSSLSEKIVATTKKEASGAKREEIRDFTPEEQTLFENFAVTKKIKKQIIHALENMTLAAYTGNVIITGDAGLDTVRMAKNLIKEYQASDEYFSGKLAKITGEKINQRNIKDVFEKLNNGGIIIEKANGMSEEKLYELAINLNQDTLGIVVIMEDTKKEITKLLEKQAMIVDYFNIRIDLMEMDNNALVAYAKNYALALEYSIDELGTLALYTRIANMQSGNHVVTKDEVRDIIDEAIWKSKKSKIKNFVDVLFARRYDNEDMIVLKERDFM